MNDELAPWKRLGDLLVNRRVQLDPRFTNRRTFVEETHGGKQDSWYRVITSIETGARTNYARETLAAVECAYRLEPGTLPQSVESGTLTPTTLTNRARTLGEQMDARRIHLRKQWQELAESADVSGAHLRNFRNGEANVSPLTKAKLEVALQWEAGSIDAVLAGQEPRERSHAEGASMRPSSQQWACCRCLLADDIQAAVTLVAGNAVCAHHAREELNR